MRDLSPLTNFSNNEEEDSWISVSDIMAGLMMVFLFIAIVFMIKVEEDKAQYENIAKSFKNIKNEIYQELNKEFNEDFKKWNASLSPNLTIRFREPKILFDTGQFYLKPRFKVILNSFLPRYLRILHSDKYRYEIEEIRIEGHTSSFWFKNQKLPENERYFRNMELSQARTRETLDYILNRTSITGYRDWFRKKVATIGFSSSRLILKKDGSENEDESQRVEFKILTKAEEAINKINEIRSRKVSNENPGF